jgi:hypothetical protein
MYTCAYIGIYMCIYRERSKEREKETCYVVQVGFEFKILLILPLECWDYAGLYYHTWHLKVFFCSYLEIEFFFILLFTWAYIVWVIKTVCF